MTLQPLYLTSYPRCLCHHIHGIDDITSAEFMRSHPIYIWEYHIHCIQQHIHYICNITAIVSVPHTHFFHDITPFVCMTLHPLYV